MIHPPYWQAARDHLCRADEVLAVLVERFSDDVLTASGDLFRTLLNAIVGQQISVAAAASIWRRLLDAYPGLPPEALAEAAEETLREVGLSRQKARYIIGIAADLSQRSGGIAHLAELDDQEVLDELTKLKGVGPWTAHMVLIFGLTRPDVLPIGDIGLLRSAAKNYGWPDDAGLKELQQRLEAQAEGWRPFRTVASWYLWRDLDAEPVLY